MSVGSSWNIWDFHLHTPYSVLNNQFGNPDSPDTWSHYVDMIEQEAQQRGIAAIGVTDYFVIDGYKKLKEIQEAGRLQNILLIPNIEFRIDKIIYKDRDDSKGRRLNFHVLFSPDVPISEIEEGFLYDLDFVYENDPFEPSKTRKLKRYNLTQFGKEMQSQHHSFEDQSPFRTGCLLAVVQAEKIKFVLESRFRGKYLLILANENLSSMHWDGQDHATRKQLIQMAHGIFSSNVSDRDFGLGKKHDSVEAFIEEYKSLKPCLWGCDSHSFSERFLEPDGRNYCWIKGDVSWEGLKQVLFEPEDRVRIQEINPEPSKSIYTISNVKIDTTHINNSLNIEGINTELNPNLITIIGGRGSGKTALLDIIASCFAEGEKLTGLKDSFFHRLYIETEARRTIANQPIPTWLEFKSGEKFFKSIGDDTQIFEKANIIYLTQNHFDEYTENPNRLYKHIIDLVFDKYLDEKANFIEIKEKSDEAEKIIQGINLEIQQLRNEVDGKREQDEAALAITNGSKNDYLTRIAEMERKSGSSVELIKQLTENTEVLRTRRRDLRDAKDRLSNISMKITGFTSQFTQDAIEVNRKLVLLTNPTQTLPTEISELKDVQQRIKNLDGELTTSINATEEIITKKDNEISELSGVDKTVAEMRQKVNDFKAEIESINARIDEITEKENRISTLEDKRLSVYVDAITNVIKLKNYLQEMIGKFELDKDVILHKLDFTAIIDMHGSNEVLEDLADKINRQTISETELRNQFQTYVSKLDELINSYSTKDSAPDFKSHIKSLTNFAKNLKRKKAISESEFYNTILKPFFTVGLKIEFNQKDLSNLSMGERAVVLLKILLALDDKPLLIDQPEEHLDNRYIYEELAPAFRTAKRRRQIIIATHNANLVVNTDAEQVIVAEYNDSTLTYKVGTLENLQIRENIKQILEGGEEAFKKREEKYGLKF